MTSYELLSALADLAGRIADVESASQIEDELTISIDMQDGTQYFLTLEEA